MYQKEQDTYDGCVPKNYRAHQAESSRGGQ
jgi:hypothetical protein